MSDGRSPAPRALHPLLARLLTTPGIVEVDTSSVAAFSGAPGMHLIVFTEDPLRYRETLDLAVIVPELLAAFAHRFDVGVLLPEAARAAQPLFGFRRWPAVVLTRAGAYVGAIEGLRAWEEYTAELGRLLEAPSSKAPTIGIAVTAQPASPKEQHP